MISKDMAPRSARMLRAARIYVLIRRAPGRLGSGSRSAGSGVMRRGGSDLDAPGDGIDDLGDGAAHRDPFFCSPLRYRNETVPAAASWSPASSMYGTFCRCAFLIFFCIRSSPVSTSTWIPAARSPTDQPERQLAVGPAARCVAEDVPRAGHCLGVVPGALQLHGRMHALRMAAQMPGGLEQLGLGEVRGVDELLARRHMPLPRVLLHDPPDGPAPGVEHREPAADLGGNENRSSSAPSLR
jgi:hypothetical protein